MTDPAQRAKSVKIRTFHRRCHRQVVSSDHLCDLIFWRRCLQQDRGAGRAVGVTTQAAGGGLSRPGAWGLYVRLGQGWVMAPGVGLTLAEAGLNEAVFLFFSLCLFYGGWKMFHVYKLDGVAPLRTDPPRWESSARKN